MTTVVALTMAVLGAVCFALAATMQHHEVQLATGTTRFGLQTLRRLIRQPRWLTGVALGASGAGLNVAALFLAPVSLIQPVGVLAVPLAVTLAARRRRTLPSVGLVVGVLLSVLAVVGYVVLTAGLTVARTDGVTGSLLGAGAVATMAVALLALVAARGPHALRCLASAAGGAISFGLMTVLVKVLTQQVVSGPAVLLQPTSVVLIVGVLTALVFGGWMVQQAFSAGPAELVLACLTVLDPLVAVLLGTLLLGEGAGISTGAAWAMAGCAVVAALGVVTIGRLHPDVVARNASGSPQQDPLQAPLTKSQPSGSRSRVAA
jgi:hypothetical protein